MVDSIITLAHGRAKKIRGVYLLAQRKLQCGSRLSPGSLGRLAGSNRCPDEHLPAVKYKRQNTDARQHGLELSQQCFAREELVNERIVACDRCPAAGVWLWRVGVA
jgi:hypothetical protein